jgi:isoleucyl-tRNA synthetase
MRIGCLAVPIGYARVRNLTSASTSQSKAYSKTLLLPKTSFPLRPLPSESEVSFRQKTCDDLYKWQVRDPVPMTLLLPDVYFCSGITHKGHFSCCTTVHRTLTDIYTWVGIDSNFGDMVEVLMYFLGHALNKILKDIINRHHVLLGHRVQYVPVFVALAKTTP